MSAPLLWLVTAIYAVVAIDLFLKGNPGMALAYIGYSVGNIGLIMAIK
jgi:hypothetical protein